MWPFIYPGRFEMTINIDFSNVKYKPDIHIRLYYLLNFLSKLQTDERHHTPVLTSQEIDIDYKSWEVFRNFNINETTGLILIRINTISHAFRQCMTRNQ